MIEAGAAPPLESAGTAGRAAMRRSPWLIAGGVLSLVLFWVPLWAPLIQLATLAFSVRAARRAGSDRLSWRVAAAGAVLGFLLSLVLEYLFVV